MAPPPSPAPASRDALPSAAAAPLHAPPPPPLPSNSCRNSHGDRVSASEDPRARTEREERGRAGPPTSRGGAAPDPAGSVTTSGPAGSIGGAGDGRKRRGSGTRDPGCGRAPPRVLGRSGAEREGREEETRRSCAVLKWRWVDWDGIAWGIYGCRVYFFFDFEFEWRWARLRRACGARFACGRLNTGADGLEWIVSSRLVSVNPPAKRGFEFGGGRCLV